MPTTATVAQSTTPAPNSSKVDAIGALVRELEATYAGRITGSLEVPALVAQYAAFPEDLDPRLLSALETRGVARLYSHQREALDCIRRGDHTVIVTPTASGKSLCYNLPVIDAALKSRHKALYLFPTKALSQDQVAELSELNTAGGLGVRAFTFDGDTPGDARKAVRTRGDIVVSNPDMLHQGILPHHTKWAQFFESLHYVVIDEMHTYRGVFGSHMANVVRRLLRVCAFYGTRPTFVMCSATIANPQELAMRLVGENVTAITQSGAPRGAKRLLFWNPPVVNSELGIRASARSQTARIAKHAVKAGLKSIVFAQTRVMVEVLTKYLKDTFDKDPRRAPRVRAYRGGYLPTQRRETERTMRAGKVDCVVATSALELGIDVGSLDVCVLNGYPGTIAGTWQRIGRAGRRERDALGVLVATSQPLDQFIVRNPEFFIGSSPEHARIDPDQLLILLDHVRCAAFELPFHDGESFGGGSLEELLGYLEEEQMLHHEGDQWHWMADSYPANAVSLRSVSEGNFVVIDITGGAKNVIAEVDYSGAPMTLYEGAIYMIQARPWQVERLDWAGRKAFVRATKADYFTEAIDYTRLKILEAFMQDDKGAGSRSAHGEIHLVRRVPGYKKIRYYTHENVGYGHIDLPDQEMHTTSVWWQLSPDLIENEFASRSHAIDGLLGASHAMHFVAALLCMSEPQDLGRAVGNGDGSWFAYVGARGAGHASDAQDDPVDLNQTQRLFQPTVFLYDNYPGGIGLSEPLYALRDAVLERASSLIESCSCRVGCPSCIGPILSNDESTDDSRSGLKQAALRILCLLRATAPPS